MHNQVDYNISRLIKELEDSEIRQDELKAKIDILSRESSVNDKNVLTLKEEFNKVYSKYLDNINELDLLQGSFWDLVSHKEE